MKKRVVVYLKVGLISGLSLCFSSQSALGGVIFSASGSGLVGGSRWDAAPRTIGGVGERSMNGGLRYSLQGGSFQAYRDLFTWNTVPSVAQFQTAVEQAFSAWSAPDPVSGLTSKVLFNADLSTIVVGSNTGSGGVSVSGAEIDLFGSTDAGFWNVGNSGTQGETRFGGIGSTVTLTSGVPNYPGTFAISGADIIINSNPQAVYNLDLFRRLLSHEIGHAIGLGDVENSINASRFIDDNFDGTNSTTIVSTLNNSWTSLVNPLDPANSAGLSVYTVPDSATSTAGVNILMESFGLGIAAGNPTSNLFPLSNDDYGIRQFLYPSLTVVPEPSSFTLLAIAGCVQLLVRCRRRG